MDAFIIGANSKTSNSKKANREKSKDQALPWVEKYRPRTVEQLAYQTEVVSVLKKCISSGDLPNLLFYGPPGTGKTSAILAAARQMFGSELFKSRVLELNASDERGIQVIRDRPVVQVKGFARVAVASGGGASGRTVPSLKLVILDEADSMTTAAQAALRRTMERESRTTRFCLVCNYISRIISPLTSRCAKFRFKPLSTEAQTERLRYICEQENVVVEDEALKLLIDYCEGDLRKSITYLQSGAKFHLGGLEGEGPESLTVADVTELAGAIPFAAVDHLIKCCKTSKYETVEAAVQGLQRHGYSANQLLSQLHDRVVGDDELAEVGKAVVCETIALCESRLLDGASEYLQAMDAVVTLMTCYANSSKSGAPMDTS